MLATIIVIAVVLGVVGLTGFVLVSMNNALVRTREAWSSIDVQLKRRANLIPGAYCLGFLAIAFWVFRRRDVHA